jgi:hypothetical protein
VVVRGLGLVRCAAGAVVCTGAGLGISAVGDGTGFSCGVLESLGDAAAGTIAAGEVVAARFIPLPVVRL